MSDLLSVLTLNCWNVSPPFDERVARIRAGIEALQPDLIGLQEIVVRDDGFDQGAIVLRDLGYEWRFAPAFWWDDEGNLRPPGDDGVGFGNLVASRHPIRRSDWTPLPGWESGEGRSVVGAVVDAPCGPVTFACTHLNWKYHHGNVRERQVVATAKFVEDLGAGVFLPPILVGDLNAEPESAEVRFLCGLQSLEGQSVYYQDAWQIAGDGGPGITWDNRNPFAATEREPDRRIDYVLVGLPREGRGCIEDARVVMNDARNGVYPSDHFGVMAWVKM
jgi:endonuclease/exonuclease/phosphatase family metal-dependent hydrolase